MMCYEVEGDTFASTFSLLPNFFQKTLKPVWFFKYRVLTFAGAFEKGVSKSCLVCREFKVEI